MGQFGIASARYLGPDDGEIRTGAPDYQGGRTYPVDPAAHARLRDFWQAQRTEAENKSARALARALQKRRKARGSESMKRASLEQWEKEQLAALIEAGSSDEVLEEWRQAAHVNGNTMKRILREMRPQPDIRPPKSAEDAAAKSSADASTAAEPPAAVEASYQSEAGENNPPTDKKRGGVLWFIRSMTSRCTQAVDRVGA